MWTGPSQKSLLKLAAELGVKTFTQYEKGSSTCELPEGVFRHTALFPVRGPFQALSLIMVMFRIDSTCRRINQDLIQRSKLDVPSTDCSVASWLTRQVGIHRHARLLIEISCNMVFGTSSQELPMLYFLAYCGASGGVDNVTTVGGEGIQKWRFDGGAHQISVKLADILAPHVFLSDAVHTIRTVDDNLVHVETYSQKVYSGKRVIVAVPPNLAARFRYLPQLPTIRQTLLEKYSMGSTVKVIIVYRTAFWRSLGLNGTAMSSIGPATCVMDASSARETPALVAFIVGPAGRAWSAMSAGDRLELLLTQLVKLFDQRARTEIVDMREIDWSQDPYSCGCPVAAPSVGVLSTIAEPLRQPTGLIHWAGTEASTVSTGFMDGAVIAGVRAATEVITVLKGGPLPDYVSGNEYVAQGAWFTWRNLVLLVLVAILAVVLRRMYQ
eukprot:TRINITY_DN2147_c0_g1_i1.p1 TRINITY_DN2147_c0_g1~~TRINITY_DN2147_c0_g1_i1.p1  ORF type:complete len:440 (-),score=83.11 TRINITY_DN2147_c0_g1_i1:1097-2416(-)